MDVVVARNFPTAKYWIDTAVRTHRDPSQMKIVTDPQKLQGFTGTIFVVNGRDLSTPMQDMLLSRHEHCKLIYVNT